LSFKSFVRFSLGVSSSARSSGESFAAFVRLKWCSVGVVKVHFCALKKRAVSNCNCVVETQGGEQRDEKDQSVTTSSENGGQRELDSVGVIGRAR
jgi:hypothetical protein